MPLTSADRELIRNPYRDLVVCIHQGKLLEITYVPSRKKEWHRGRRGTVKGFTRSARLRMLRTVASIQWAKIPYALFVTLTYPAGTEAFDIRRRSQQLHCFLRDTEKHLSVQIPALWRIEWKVRKSGAEKGQAYPHYHLLLLGVEFLHRDFINRTWKRAINFEGYCRTDVRRCHEGDMAAKYVSKYCSKLPDSPSLVNASYLNNLGRHWGIHRKSLIPFFEQTIFCSLNKQELELAENAACMVFLDFTRGARSGFTLLGDLAEKVGKEITARHLDSKPRSR